MVKKRRRKKDKEKKNDIREVEQCNGQKLEMRGKIRFCNFFWMIFEWNFTQPVFANV